MSDPCVVNDRETGACNRADYLQCPAPPGPRGGGPGHRTAPPCASPAQTAARTTVDGFPTSGAPVGTPVGAWLPLERGCVDITALNPPPSPGEVFRYFQTLPLPQLPTRQQPPGNGLVGLPVIFFTDGPTTQTFTLDIRGFAVDITATASSFTWRTGDGTELTTTDPGAPYPAHTISHDYASGTWTASLTTTWTATFSVDGGLTVPVPGEHHHRRAAGHLRRPPGPTGPHQPVRLRVTAGRVPPTIPSRAGTAGGAASRTGRRPSARRPPRSARRAPSPDVRPPISSVSTQTPVRTSSRTRNASG